MSLLKNRPLALLIVLLGPLLSFIFASNYISSLSAKELIFTQFILVLVWSPLFFSIPAFIMQDVRDSALKGRKGLLQGFFRGFELLWFLNSKENKERYLFRASLVGWVVLIIVAFPSIMYVSELLLK